MSVLIPIFACDITYDFSNYGRKLSFDQRSAGQHIHHSSHDGSPVAVDAEWSQSEVHATVSAPDGSKLARTSCGETRFFLSGSPPEVSLGLSADDVLAFAQEGIDDLALV